MFKNLAVAFVFALVAVVVASPAVAGGWETYDESMAESWQAKYNSGDVAAVASYYAEDGMRMPPNDKAVSGREVIAAFIQQGIEMGLAKVELGTDEVEVSGDLGFARGTYVILDPEGNRVDSGKWIQIGKKIDGMWYAYRDIWNSDNPLPE